MPLILEVNDLENDQVLCFLPNGHLSDDGFSDFPAQTGQTCWYYTTRRLVSLRHTQRQFDKAQYNILATKFEQAKDQYCEIDLIKEMVATILFLWLHDNQLQVDQTKLTLLQANLNNYIDDKVKHNLSKESVADVYLAMANRDLFEQVLIDTGLLIIEDLPNFCFITRAQYYKNYFMLTAKYFTKLENKILNNQFDNDEVLQFLSRFNITNLVKSTNLFLQSLLGIAYDLNEAIIPIRDEQIHNHRAVKSFMKNTLFTHGPLLVFGFVGKVFYPGCEPIACGNFGSVKLYGYDSKKYAHAKTGVTNLHIVLVIGICKNKVIYQDPLFASEVAGERKAMVMDANKFIDRIIEASKIIGRNVLRFSTLKPGEIDTSMELFEQQTLAPRTAKPRIC